MMKKLFLILITSTELCCSISAQSLVDVIDKNFQNHKLISASKSNMEGSPYLYDEFIPTEIVLKDDRSIKNFKTKFDLYNKVLVVKLNDHETALNMKAIVSFVLELSNEKLIFMRVNDSFLQIINEGSEHSFYKKYEKNFVRGRSSNGYDPGTKDKLIDIELYVWKYKDKFLEFDSIAKVIKSISDQFPDKEKELSELKKSKTFKSSDDQNQVSAISRILAGQ